eukprot:GHVT01024777.1.p1 GENE.GHVT01024777.1~~GHVT01024777.1.p1  ORF type:complete len:131 (-),score=25.87 GHVT01024777.1:206-598(-)
MVRTRANIYSIASSSRCSLAEDPSIPPSFAIMASSSAPPVDTVARSAIEQHQSTPEKITALLSRTQAPAGESLVPPSAQDLQALLVKNSTAQASFQAALFPPADATTPWHFKKAINVIATDAKDIPARKL